MHQTPLQVGGIKMSATASIYFPSELPWSSSKSENKTFFSISVLVLVLTVLFSTYVVITELPDIPRAEKEKLPPQLAQIIQAKTPPPPPVVEVEPEVKEPEPEEIEPIEDIQKPIEKPQPVIEPKKPVEPKQEEVAKARETAKSKGVLKFADTLASMRQQANLSNLANTNVTTGGGQAEQTVRNVIAAPTLQASGGIQTGNLSSDVGASGELEGRRNTEFVAPTEGEATIATQRIEETQQVIGSRDLDQIRQILDANKGAVYSLYRRALRQDPSIEGKLTVKLIIEPNGSLSAVTLIDSELDAPDLVKKLIARIGLINFGEANVTRTELEYAYNFLPF